MQELKNIRFGGFAVIKYIFVKNHTRIHIILFLTVNDVLKIDLFSYINKI